jgi:uncharacterized protein (TIGR03118 family)
MLRRRIVKHSLRNLFILTIAGLCAGVILAGWSTSAKLAPNRRPERSPRSAGQQQQSPENYTTTMYGGNGGHSNSDSINDGSLVTIDQTTAAITLVGHPNSVDRLTGLAFDSTGKLFGSTITAGGFPPPPPVLTSKLVTINPANGGLVSTVGNITAGSGGPIISIADLAVQPGTDTLFGIRGSNDGGFGQGKLYTINKTTAVATLVGNTNCFFPSIAFAPGGTLYESAADLDFMTGNIINTRFMTVNPSNGAVITSIAAAQFFGALGVRPTDGVIFAGNGDSHQIFTINATTAVLTLIGDTGQNFVGDIAFSPIVNSGVNAYRQTNLVSDVPGYAQILDSSLVNPWGISSSATSPFWSSNNGTGTATLYGGDNAGGPLTKNTLTVTIPGGANTGTVFNGSTSFPITDGSGTGPARFIFDTENGTISAWRSGSVAIQKVSDPNAVYKGLAIGSDPTFTWIYAANFKAGRIDTYGTNFTTVHFAGSDFTDPTLPAGYAPFNVQNLGGKIYVTYALQDAPKHDDVPGAGHGFVNVFDAVGQFQRRLISGGALNSPWGLAIAPTNFGLFGNALLVGNFGDGRINGYDPNTGAFLGTLNDQSGNAISIEGLWALTFGNGVGGGDLNTLYFSAGIGAESHGLFGKLAAAAPAGILFQFSSATYSISEGAGFIDITVNRVGELSQPASVNFATYALTGAGHASHQTDFVPSLGTLKFAGGEGSKTFRVLIVDDAYVEGDETFRVALSNPTGSGLGVPSTADVTITDNDTSGATSPLATTFVATLSGAQEVPPKVTNGTGTGIVIVSNEATGAAKASLAFSGLTSNSNAAHIHGPAAVGVNAPVLFPMPIVTGSTSGGVNDVAITLSTPQIQQMKDGLFYFNVHDTNNPGGEIRGQIFSNPIDEAGYFARQNYLDFLNRQPDASGLSFWTSQVTGCGVNTNCISNKRIDVSKEFFFSQEFQTTDFYVYRVFKASFGALPTFSEFTLDRSQIGAGSDAEKKTFTEGFVQRGDFLGVYPTAQTGSQFIDKVIATVLAGSGVDLSSKKPDLENEYSQETTQTASRARVIRRVVDYTEFVTPEFNRGFVAAEYYGYLRRDPDTAGFNFWLGVLNNNVPGNVRSMVCGFITSAEYQLRFGPTVTRNNVECSTVAP